MSVRGVASVLCAALGLVASAAFAQPAPVWPTEEVPYVRTPQAVVDAMLRLAAPRPKDFLVDLGSGDGRIVITAAKRYGTRGLGVDIDGTLVAEARARAAAAGVAGRARFEQRDLFATDLASATIVTMYLLPEHNLLLRPKLLAELGPGARVVSHDWDMGEWRPDARLTIPVPDKPVGIARESTVYLWVVPARVAGRWRAELSAEGESVPIELAFTQTFQDLAGEARIEGRGSPIERGVVNGERLSFRLASGGKRWYFEGRMRGDRIDGEMSVDGGRPRPWRAFRAP